MVFTVIKSPALTTIRRQWILSQVLLSHKYIDIGLDTPEKIMAKYTPPSLEKGGPWAKGVNQFMSDLE